MRLCGDRCAALAATLSSLSRVPLAAQGIPQLDEAISGLSVPMRVLVIAAHPDDEDTQLITWLARGRHVETAYLSLTRGDGGQNLLGNELGEALGVDSHRGAARGAAHRRWRASTSRARTTSVSRRRRTRRSATGRRTRFCAMS